MKLIIATTDKENTDFGKEFVNWILKSANDCPYKIHEVVESTQEADAILFINRAKRSILSNTFLKIIFQKSFLLDNSDVPIDYMRGIYTSMPRKRFRTMRHHAYGYLSPINEFIEETFLNLNGEPDLFFSFMGSTTSSVRKNMFKRNLFADTHDIIIENTSGFSTWVDNSEEREKRRKYYAEVLGRSKFVLCPRGGGSSTYRLYEAMQMGRVPVIIADDWVPPMGPAWQTFSIRLAESKIAETPQILESFMSRHTEMGKLAREAWEQWFAPNVQFHRIAEYILDLICLGENANSAEINSWVFSENLLESKNYVRSIARTAALKIRINPFIASVPKTKNNQIL